MHRISVSIGKGYAHEIICVHKERSEDCKRKMLAALEEHLDELTTEMSDMSKDAECREERDLVKRYVEKLRDML